MRFTELSCEDFIEKLASDAPVPGGGGASALAGAIGTALGNMVGSLTVGRKKYADVEADIIALKKQATELQDLFIALLKKDADVFEPLSRAYGLPKETPEQQAEKDRVMEAALREASQAPLEIMEACCKAIDLHKEFAQKGTAIAISDVGVGVALCRAALHGASLNVFINTKSMKDREYAAKIDASANQMLNEYTALADEIYASVRARFN